MLILHRIFSARWCRLKSVTKPQDGALVGQAAISAQAREPANKRHVVQRFFHGLVAERESLPHEVNA